MPCRAHGIIAARDQSVVSASPIQLFPQAVLCDPLCHLWFIKV